MSAIQPHEVLSRVLAWHNRHPLALRITADQVHSLGQVLLPFASNEAGAVTAAQASAEPAADFTATQPAVAPVAEPEANVADEVVAEGAPQPAEAAAGAADGASSAEDAPAEATNEATNEATSEANDKPADEAVELELEFDPAATSADAPDPDEASADADDAQPDDEVAEAADAAQSEAAVEDPAEAPAAVAPEGDGATEAAAVPLAERLKAARERAMAGAVPADDPALAAADAPPPIAAVTTAVTAAVGAAAATAPEPMPPSRARWWRRLWPLGRAAKLAPLFDAEFMWPIAPRHVARWAQAHGSETPLEWDEQDVRVFDPDMGALAAQRRAGLSHLVHRHLLTAAVGVGDRRIRLLIDAQGRVLGPRAYDRRRVKAVASLGGVALLTLALLPWWLYRPASPESGGEVAAELALASASAASQPASAEVIEAPPAATVAAEVAKPAVPAPRAETPAPVSVDTPVPAAVAHAEAPPKPAQPEAPPLPAVPQQARKPIPLGRIGPIFDDETRLLARQRSAQARKAHAGDLLDESGAVVSAAEPKDGDAKAKGKDAAKPVTPAYALVTVATRQKDNARAVLAQMMSVRASLPPPVAEHGDVMAHGGQWRAAWWPFASAEEAERARRALSVRGVQTEVVEF